MHVAGEPVELGDRDRATLAARLRKSSGKLWAAIESIRAFAGFYLDVDLDQIEAFRRGEPFKGLFLRFDPEAGFALLCRRNPNVTDQFACHCRGLPGLCNDYMHVLIVNTIGNLPQWRVDQ